MKRRLLVTYAAATLACWAFLYAVDGASVADFSVAATLGAGVPPGAVAGVMLSNLRIGPTWPTQGRPKGVVGLRAGFYATGSYYLALCLRRGFARGTERIWFGSYFGHHTIQDPPLIALVYFLGRAPAVLVGAGAGLLTAHVVCSFCDDVAAIRA